MQVNIITLFPNMFNGVFEESIIARARKNNLITINMIDLRVYGEGRHHVVDDTPYGGGGGMIMKSGPIARALEDLDRKGHVILTSPRGRLFQQDDALRLSKMPALTILCGHYEGIDERISTLFVDEEFSIGDYVLTGGEIPAMALMDATCRLIPGVTGQDTTLSGDSHYEGVLEHPHYTRPPEFMGLSVPQILLSGDHKKVAEWRRGESLRITRARRPDLFEKLELSKLDRKLMDEEE